MKRSALILGIILVASATAYCFYFRAATAKTRPLTEGGPEAAGLVWLQREFALSEPEMETLRAAHARFLPRCAEHCRALAEARQQLSALSDRPGASTAELVEKSQSVSRIEQECFSMTLANIDEISALMPPEAGARYRSLMRNRLIEHRSAHHRLFSSRKKSL